jgi:hypothetical protein
VVWNWTPDATSVRSVPPAAAEGGAEPGAAEAGAADAGAAEAGTPEAGAAEPDAETEGTAVTLGGGA